MGLCIGPSALPNCVASRTQDVVLGSDVSSPMGLVQLASRDPSVEILDEILIDKQIIIRQRKFEKEITPRILREPFIN